MYKEDTTRIIDFHTHTFPEKIVARAIAALEEKAGVKAWSNGTIDGLKESMKASGVDLSVIMPVVTRPEQFRTVNDYAARINELYGDCIISFGGIHPDSPHYKEELDYIKSLGLKGIKIHPDYQGVMIDDMKYKRIIDYASQLDLIVMTHAGIDIGIPEPVHCPPMKSLEIIKELQPAKFILAHMGGWKQWDDVESYLAGTEVYLDCAFCAAYMSPEQFERIVRKHGADKIVFATDSPWESAENTISWIEQTSLTEEEKQLMYYLNAADLLGLRG